MTNNLANVNTPGFRQDRVSFARIAGEAAAAAVYQGPLGNPGLVGQPGAAVRGPAVRTHADGRPGRSRNDRQVPTIWPSTETPTLSCRHRRARSTPETGRSPVDPTAPFSTAAAIPFSPTEGRSCCRRDATSLWISSGRVFADTEEIGQLRLVDLPEEAALEHVGSNLIRSASPATDSETAGVVQGSVERSNVEAVETLVQMMAWMRSFEANQSALMTQDAGLGRLIEWASR